MKNVLVVDNQISVCDILFKFLTRENYQVVTTTRGQSALEISQKHNFDLVIADYHLPDMDGKILFDELQKHAPATPMILMGREVALKNAVAMIRRGAKNFIAKPLNPDELLEAMNESNDTLRGPQPRPLQEKQPAASASSLMSARCAKVKAILDQVKRVGPTNFSVIIQGETGTGKESLARQIHHVSNRKHGPFVAVDCGCLSKEIAGSELFGHEKGAFTGAIVQKTGFFEQANGGTIFLDEIANLSLDIQMALLRALQEKVIRKVGGSKEIPIDVRIIAASHENLSEKTEAVNFREDLYFRLCEYTLEIPPLRERPDDIPLFVDFFLEQTSRELGIPKPTVNAEVSSCLLRYNWPGNIRELKNVIRRSCLFTDRNNEIQLDSLAPRVTAFLESDRSIRAHAHEHTREAITEPGNTGEDLKATALKAESRRILEVLEKVRFNKSKAAKILNIHRKTLYMKLKLMNIEY